MFLLIDYAKLVRKRDKAASLDSSQPRMEIDMETLRASARAATEREQLKAEREKERERDRAVTGGKSGPASQSQDSMGAVMSSSASVEVPGLGLDVASVNTNGETSMMNGVADSAAEGWRSYAENQSPFMRGMPGPGPMTAVSAGRPGSS